MCLISTHSKVVVAKLLFFFLNILDMSWGSFTTVNHNDNLLWTPSISSGHPKTNCGIMYQAYVFASPMGRMRRKTIPPMGSLFEWPRLVWPIAISPWRAPRWRPTSYWTLIDFVIHLKIWRPRFNFLCWILKVTKYLRLEHEKEH